MVVSIDPRHTGKPVTGCKGFKVGARVRYRIEQGMYMEGTIQEIGERGDIKILWDDIEHPIWSDDMDDVEVI